MFVMLCYGFIMKYSVVFSFAIISLKMAGCLKCDCYCSVSLPCSVLDVSVVCDLVIRTFVL